MNKNIEIINSYLWAVRFNLIPLIPEIDYKPDSEKLYESMNTAAEGIHS